MSLLGKRQLGAEKQAPRLTVAPHPSGAHAPPCQAEPCACRQPRKTGISGTIDLGFVNSQPCLPSGRSSAPAVRLRISPRAPAMLCEPTRLFPQPPCSPRNSGGGHRQTGVFSRPGAHHLWDRGTELSACLQEGLPQWLWSELMNTATND